MLAQEELLVTKRSYSVFQLQGQIVQASSFRRNFEVSPLNYFFKDVHDRLSPMIMLTCKLSSTTFKTTFPSLQIELKFDFRYPVLIRHIRTTLHIPQSGLLNHHNFLSNASRYNTIL